MRVEISVIQAINKLDILLAAENRHIQHDYVAKQFLLRLFCASHLIRPRMPMHELDFMGYNLSVFALMLTIFEEVDVVHVKMLQEN